MIVQHLGGKPEIMGALFRPKTLHLVVSAGRKGRKWLN